jgi:tetratricopeptide (TPR) repeat protein
MGEADVTIASSKLAKAQEVAALKGLRAAVPFYIEATDALAEEGRHDAAVGVLAEVLSAREKKRGLFGSKDINPLGPDRAVVGKQFARLTRGGQINDDTLELLSQLALEQPDDQDVRLANAEGLYRAGYMADAIDEYRYCQKLIPDDGALVARLGELYGVMNRNTEAVDHLRQGIGELMQAHHFDEIAFFANKLVDLSPQAANDVQRWVDSLPDEALQVQRIELERLIESVRDKGLDDGRWASLEQRVESLPELEPQRPRIAAPQETAPALEEPAPAYDGADYADVADPSEEEAPAAASHGEVAQEPEPVWGSKTGNVQIGRNAWADVSNVEPASEDEMRMLLGPASHAQAEPEREAAHAPEPVAAPRVAASSPPPPPRPAPAVNGAQPASVPARPAQSAGAALPPGLAAFTRRKADAAFNAGDFAGAAQAYERLLKGGFEAEVAAPLLECYLGTERFEEAAGLSLQLADRQAEAGELDKAVATLALVLEHTSNADVEARHAELVAAK